MPSIQIYRPDQLGLAGAPTVESVVDSYLRHSASQGTSARAREDRERVLGLFVRSFGPRAVIDLCPDDLEEWIGRQDSLKSAWSRRRWCTTINAALNWAQKKKRLIPYNPLAGVTIRPGKRGRPLTNREFAGIIREATDKRFRRLVLFLRYTGCRPGEAASARWSDLDSERGAIVLAQHKTCHVVAEPRVIYLPPQAVRLLALIARTDRQEPHIFVNGWGNPWRQNALSARMAGIRDRAGIPKDAKLYGNRHRYACDAILSGVELKTLSLLMGHTTTRTTEYYVHLAGKDAHLRSAVEKIKH